MPGICAQSLDLVTRQRPREIGHDPACAEYNGFVFVHVVQQEAPLAKPRQGAFHRLFVKVAITGALEPFHHARLVTLCLQAADKPGAGVGQAFVIEVDRVLCRKHQPESIGPGLLQQSQEQFFRRRVCDRRHVAKDLIHVEDGSQARGARLCTHPGDDFAKQHRNEEHTARIVKMSDRHYRNTRLAVFGVKKVLCLERLTLHPRLKAGRGEQVVELHRQRKAVLRWEKIIDVHNAHTRQRRILNRTDQSRDVEIATFLPGLVKQTRDQDMLTACDRICIDTKQCKYARCG